MSSTDVLTAAELRQRRRNLLAHLHTSPDDLAARARENLLTERERAVWESLTAIDFLLGDDRAE